jgi:hypothetical protein
MHQMSLTLVNLTGNDLICNAVWFSNARGRVNGKPCHRQTT